MKTKAQNEFKARAVLSDALVTSQVRLTGAKRVRVMNLLKRAIAATLSLWVITATAQVAPAWRGLPGTTFQQWEFTTPGPTPEQSANQCGQATAASLVGWGGTGWHDTLWPLTESTGLWDYGTNGTVTITVPRPDGDAYAVQLQIVVYWEPGTYALDPILFIPWCNQVAHDRETLNVNQLGGSWILERYLFTGPFVGQITIAAPVTGMLLDTVCVDTATDLSVTTVGLSQGQLAIHHEGIGGQLYTMQSSTDLVNWENEFVFVQPYVNGATWWFNATHGTRFYRVTQ